MSLPINHSLELVKATNSNALTVQLKAMLKMLESFSCNRLFSASHYPGVAIFIPSSCSLYCYRVLVFAIFSYGHMGFRSLQRYGVSLGNHMSLGVCFPELWGTCLRSLLNATVTCIIKCKSM